MSKSRLTQLLHPRLPSSAPDKILVARLALAALIAPAAVPAAFFLLADAVPPAVGEVRPIEPAPELGVKKILLRATPSTMHVPGPQSDVPGSTPFGLLPGASSDRPRELILQSPVLGVDMVLRDANHAIKLDGLAPWPAERICVRLDGLRESCNQRATERAAVVMQGREVTCKVTQNFAGQDSGQCFAGSIDIGADLAANGVSRNLRMVAR